MSDKNLTENCGLLNKLLPGDTVLAGWWEDGIPLRGGWRCIAMDSGGPSVALVGLELLRQRRCADSSDTQMPQAITI